MTGTIVNAGGILVGSLLGSIFKKRLSDRLGRALLDAMGFVAVGIGLNFIVQNLPKSQYPVLFIISLALGCLAGTLLRLDERVQRLTERAGASGALGQGLITACLIFCLGTMSILGPVQAALRGDHTLLFTNASLDFVTAMVFAANYGIGIAVAGAVLFCWQGAIYALTLLVGAGVSDAMLTELSIVGGFLIAMSGLSILKIKTVRTLDYLPALLVPIVWCLVA